MTLILSCFEGDFAFRNGDLGDRSDRSDGIPLTDTSRNGDLAF